MFRLTTMPLAVLAFVGVLTFALPTRASQGEHALSATASYAGIYADSEGDDDLHGLGLTLGYRYGVSDFFTFVCDISYLPLPWTGGDVAHMGMLRAGMTYTIDALEWVPWLGLQAGLFVGSHGETFDQGLAAGLGLDYRPRRNWSVGVEAWYHAMFDRFENFPAMLTVGLRGSWYPGKGD